MLFGKEFTILENENLNVFREIGVNYPEFFIAYVENEEFVYYIFDELFGQFSLANTMETEYAIELRNKCNKILQELIDEGKIKLKDKE